MQQHVDADQQDRSRPTRRACRRLAATSCWSWPTATSSSCGPHQSWSPSGSRWTMAGRGTRQDAGAGRVDGRPNRHARRRWACHVRLPYAPRSHQRPAWPLPQVRHEAPRRGASPPADGERSCRDTRRRCRDAPRRGCDAPPPGRDAPRHGHGQGLRRSLGTGLMGRRHGGGQSAEYDRDHALEIPRSHRWDRQHGNRLAVHRRAAGSRSG
jgi:hypothetical protein